MENILSVSVPITCLLNSQIRKINSYLTVNGDIDAILQQIREKSKRNSVQPIQIVSTQRCLCSKLSSASLDSLSSGDSSDNIELDAKSNITLT